MSRPQLSAEQRTSVFINFVSSAWDIIQEDGMESLTLRKVAARAGCNSATLYHYFRDLDELSTYAALGFLREWEQQLVTNVQSITDPLLRLYAVWDNFCQLSFRRPQLFYTLFFGKYSNELEEISARYFEVFPHAQVSPSEEAIMGQSFGRGTLFQRNIPVLTPLVEAGLIPQEKLSAYSEIMVYCFKALLLQKTQQGDALDSDQLTAQQMEYIRIILRQ